MKKKLLAIVLSVCTAFSIAACGGDDDGGEKKTTGKITLGDYKGVKVDATLEKVEQKDIDNYLDNVLKSKATEEEVKEGTFAKDEIAKLDYTCTIDGKEYKKQTGAKISVDDKGFDVKGFTDSIIGKKVGDEYEIKLTLAKDFGDSSVAGKEATFKIKLQAKIKSNIPEFTDEFVSKNFGYLDLKTKDDMLKYLEQDLRINQIYGDIWEKVIIGTAKVDSYDSDELAALKDLYEEEAEYNIYQYTNMKLEDYLTSIKQSKDDFMKQIEEDAKADLKQEMVVKAIKEKEGIEITDKHKTEYAKRMGYDSVEALKKAYESYMTSDEFTEQFEYAVTAYIVQNFVCENVEFVEGFGLRVEEPTSTQGTTGNETTTGDETTTAGEGTTGDETTTAGGETTTGDETTTAGEEKSTEEETTTAA